LGGAAAAKLIPFTPKEVEAVESATKTIDRVFEHQKCRQGPFKAGDVVRNARTNETFLVRHAEAARVTTRRRGSMFGMRGTGEMYGDPKNKRWDFQKIVTKPEEKGWKTFEYHGGKMRSALVIVPMTALAIGDSVTFTATPLSEYEGYDDLWFVGCAHEQGQTTP
jgi:hypothetical protein